MRVEVYRSFPRRQWRWRLVAKNGRKVANGGESYHNRGDLLDVVTAIFGGRFPIEDRG